MFTHIRHVKTGTSPIILFMLGLDFSAPIPKCPLKSVGRESINNRCSQTLPMSAGETVTMSEFEKILHGKSLVMSNIQSNLL